MQPFFYAMKNLYLTYRKRHARSQRTSMCRARLSLDAFETAHKRYLEVTKGHHFNADYQDFVQLKKTLCLDVSLRA